MKKVDLRILGEALRLVLDPSPETIERYGKPSVNREKRKRAKRIGKAATRRPMGPSLLDQPMDG